VRKRATMLRRSGSLPRKRHSGTWRRWPRLTPPACFPTLFVSSSVQVYEDLQSGEEDRVGGGDLQGRDGRDEGRRDRVHGTVAELDKAPAA
jgi:hypothetical protein